MTRKYYWAENGEWIRVTKRGYKEQCCDCGLVHRMNFRIDDGKVWVQAFRDERATSGARKSFRFTKDTD